MRGTLASGAALVIAMFGASVAHAGAAPVISIFADFDGDGITDVGVYNTTNGDWFIELSGGGPIMVVPGFGGPIYQPVPADYDGDGLADTAVYNTTNGDWFLNNTTDPLRVVPGFGGGNFSPSQASTEGSDT